MVQEQNKYLTSLQALIKGLNIAVAKGAYQDLSIPAQLFAAAQTVEEGLNLIPSEEPEKKLTKTK